MDPQLFKIKNTGNGLYVTQKHNINKQAKECVCPQKYISCNIPYCYICAAPYAINRIDEFMFNGNVITTR